MISVCSSSPHLSLAIPTYASLSLGWSPTHQVPCVSFHDCVFDNSGRACPADVAINDAAIPAKSVFLTSWSPATLFSDTREHQATGEKRHFPCSDPPLDERAYFWGCYCRSLSCTTRAPCRSVIRANGQRVTAAQYVVTATSKSSTPATCSTILTPLLSQMSILKAKWVLVFLGQILTGLARLPSVSIAHVVASCLLPRLLRALPP